MRHMITALLLTGCWKPAEDLSVLSFDQVPYDNPYLTSTDAVVSAFDTQLTCPDGSPSRIFMVHRQELAEDAPVAIVLHSGAFDYVVDPSDQGYLEGRHYRVETRLSRAWSVAKMWETLGLSGVAVDPSEENLGTLPAALTDAGYVQLYPGNCWGDLWHNEEGYQDSAFTLEGFPRNGRTVAHWMIRMAVEPDFAASQGVTFPTTLDPSAIDLIGLGEGGRGVTELLLRDDMPAIRGAVWDSTPDDLGPYLDDPDTHQSYVDGLARIFVDEDLARIDDWSLTAAAAAGALPGRVAYLWSDGDPRQEDALMAAGAQAVASVSGAWVENLETPRHVFLNGDLELATGMVNFLLTGLTPDEQPTPAEGDTGI